MRFYCTTSICQFYKGFIEPAAEEICELDMDVYSAAMEQLKNNAWDVKTAQNGNISGEISMAEDGFLATSVPYDKGFTILADGKKVSAQTFADTFMMIPLSKGTHRIQFVYYSDGFWVGIVITIASALILLGAIVWHVIRRCRISRNIPFVDRNTNDNRE